MSELSELQEDEQATEAQIAILDDILRYVTLTESQEAHYKKLRAEAGLLLDTIRAKKAAA